jgi:hypothetical protein
MTIRRRPFLLILLALLAGSMTPCHAQPQVELETGLVFSGYNDVRIPGEGGTLFSLSEELETDPSSFFRLSFRYAIGKKHHLGLLVAPLRLEAGGSLDRSVLYMDQEFPAGAQLRSRYRFDSYRLTYRYDFRTSGDLHAGLGLTAKIRDASISLEGAGRRAEKTNTGFVPLINFRLHWAFARELGFLMEGDALAAPQGRAEDVLVALSYRYRERIGFHIGYRLLEGGADNDEVYNFTLAHYLVAGARVGL